VGTNIKDPLSECSGKCSIARHLAVENHGEKKELEMKRESGKGFPPPLASRCSKRTVTYNRESRERLMEAAGDCPPKGEYKSQETL